MMKFGKKQMSPVYTAWHSHAAVNEIVNVTVHKHKKLKQLL
jgi:hypothetical protein